jgi:hypothetical protein
LKKEIYRTDTSIFPDIPDPLGRLENIQLPTSEEHITEEPQLPTGNLTEHTVLPENANTAKDHHSDPPDIGLKRFAKTVKQVTFLNEEKDTDITKRQPNPKFNRRGDNTTDSEDTSVVSTARSAVENEELHPNGLKK